MKLTILLLAVFVAALSSCTTAYKTGQTPDDVYYSPARPQSEDEYVQSEKKDDQQYRNDEYYDDRYLQMKVHNRLRWSELNDWYSYDRYSYGYNYIYGSYNNPYNSWNYYYNPYCCCNTNNIFSNPKTSYTYSKPRTFNLGSYNTNAKVVNYSNLKYTNTSNRYNNTYTAPRTNSSSNKSSNSGSILRNIFSGSNNNNSSSSSSSNSNNSNSSSSSSSGSSSGSSGSSPAPVRKF